MDFSISDEQAMLADSVSRYISSEYDFERRQKFAESDQGYSNEIWQTFANLGFTAVPFAEEDGGLNGGPIELMLMMEQFGRGLIVEPFLANIVLSGGVLRRLASAEQKEKWLAPIIAGNMHSALAFAEPQSRFNIANVETTASKDGDSFSLSGRKAFVPHGGNADILIIPARTSADSADEQGITLFVVPADAEGLSRTSYATVDGLRAAELQLSDVSVASGQVLGEIDNGFTTLRDVIDEATLAVSAEAVGIMRTMHDKTLEYTKSRVQFGVPISSFQALQHRMVETLMLCEQSQSLLLWAVMTNAAGDADSRKAISALKYQVGTAGISTAREAVQMHGGMGVSWELDIAHYFKRLTAIDLMFGNADFHLDRYVELAI